jgi:hypothetical protein
MIVKPRGNFKMESDYIFKINGQALKIVDEFKYVGSIQNSEGNMSKEVITRAQKMMASFNIHRHNIFENRNLSIKSKLRCFEIFILNLALYGCETWNTKKSELKYLESIQFRLLRRIFRYNWEKHKSFADLVHECEEYDVRILPIEAMVRRARLSYFGHVCRMEDNRLPKIIMNGHLHHASAKKKVAGGQESNYKRRIQEDLKSF